MKEIIISGGYPLSGNFIPGGSKNAALPIIFATLIVRGDSILYGVPDIGDVRSAIEIIKMFGARVHRCGDTLRIDTKELHYEKIPCEMTSRIRASSYLIGACLGVFGMFHIGEFGGCNFCNRPIDMHLNAASALGAEINEDFISVKRLKGTKIYFKKQSVGATINAIIMAACADGITELFGVAEEPHVKNLISFLRSSGADIEVEGKKITVYPKPLHGGCVKIIPDMIEAGTFILMAPMSGGRITVSDFEKLELNCFFDILSNSGISVPEKDGSITVFGEPSREIHVVTGTHPSFPTDLQPQMAPLMAKFFGGSIRETVWQNRFSYLNALKPFGILSDTDGSLALIHSSEIKNASTECPDLRGGAAALITALSSEGESKIKNADIIFRGYSELIPKLKKLGANIEILNKEDT